jgi:hypothetical protein
MGMAGWHIAVSVSSRSAHPMNGEQAEHSRWIQISGEEMATTVGATGGHRSSASWHHHSYLRCYGLHSPIRSYRTEHKSMYPNQWIWEGDREGEHVWKPLGDTALAFYRRGGQVPGRGRPAKDELQRGRRHRIPEAELLVLHGTAKQSRGYLCTANQ